jgi:hypothetical protein
MTITAKDAANKLHVPVDQLTGHTWFCMSGSARIPERFWIYTALTEHEYQSLSATEKNSLVITRIIH